MSERSRRLLIVEDDPHIRQLIEERLESEGYLTESAVDGRQALNRIRLRLPDLILLDRILPGMDGLTLLKRLREFSTVPVLLMSSMKSEDDKVEGLEAGADDYLPKPFAIRELLARVKALLRRTSTTNPVGTFLTAGLLKLDLNLRRAYANQDELDLSPLEFKVLEILLANQGRVLARDELIELAWGVDYDGYDRAVDTLIKRLRKKISHLPSPAIRTIRGRGYLLEEKVSA
jgi:DNA-binding response OmpR family regulator